LRIEYDLKFRDYFLFNAVHQFLLVTAQVMFLGLGVLVFIGEFVERGVVGAFVAALIVYLAAWLVQLVANLFILHSRKNRSLLTHHVIELQPDALYEESPFSRAHYYWPGVAEVVVRPGFVAIYLNAHLAHIIPSRAFASAAQRKEFVTFTKAKLRVV
jgi:hypothetical protein